MGAALWFRAVIGRVLVPTLALAASGCGIFAGDFEIHYDATVLDVETMVETTGTRIRCDVQLTANAVGNDGDRAKWGESVWTFRAISSGATLSVQDRSAASMQAFFGTTDIGAGESITTDVIQSFQAEPFTWELSLNYRKPSGRRGNAGVTAVCEP